MENNHFAIVMAGGIGARFWPSSTPDYPKQFIDMIGNGSSLLQTTFSRLEKIVPKENIYIVTQLRYQKIILNQLGGKLNEDQIISEPDRRNTAPCILLASLKIQKRNPDAIIIVSPSDHSIQNEVIFKSDVEFALASAGNENLITFGIVPTFPATGFGYVSVKADENRLKTVLEFTEKPDENKAKSLIDSGNYYWNSGIFVWSVNAVINGFKEYVPKLFELFNAGLSKLNTPDEKKFISENYPLAENISIDYALLEKSNLINLIPASFDWDDLGSWKSIYDLNTKDSANNVVINSNVYLSQSFNNLIKSKPSKKIVISGLSDFIIVDSEDVLMICPINKDQEVKSLSEKVQNKLED